MRARKWHPRKSSPSRPSLETSRLEAPHGPDEAVRAQDGKVREVPAWAEVLRRLRPAAPQGDDSLVASPQDSPDQFEFPREAAFASVGSQAGRQAGQTLQEGCSEHAGL